MKSSAFASNAPRRRRSGIRCVAGGWRRLSRPQPPSARESAMKHRPFIIIVGVQKSGTTLLARLLVQSGVCENPFPHEGDEFWGNVPVFAPEAFPVGAIYQRSHGAFGHEIGAEDATDDVRRVPA